MIDIEIQEQANILVLTPKEEITAENIARCTDALNDYINIHDRVPNLVLRAHQLPHWKNFSALTSHLKLVKDHHKLVKKVAIVSDSTLISILRPFVDHFTNAKVRRFPEEAYDDALNWAQMDEDHPGEFLEMDGVPDDVVALDARGLITSADYRDHLVPLIEKKLKVHDKLKALIVAGPYFDGYSAGALWDDARFGLHHYTTFSKLALVTDVAWLRHSAKLFGPLIPTEIMIFDVNHLDDAKKWIAT